MKKILFFICFMCLLVLTSCSKGKETIRLVLYYLENGKTVCVNENNDIIDLTKEDIFKKVKSQNVDVYIVDDISIKLELIECKNSKYSEKYIYKNTISSEKVNVVFEVDFVAYGNIDKEKNVFVYSGKYDVIYSTETIS